MDALMLGRPTVSAPAWPDSRGMRPFCESRVAGVARWRDPRRLQESVGRAPDERNQESSWGKRSLQRCRDRRCWFRRTLHGVGRVR